MPGKRVQKKAKECSFNGTRMPRRAQPSLNLNPIPPSLNPKPYTSYTVLASDWRQGDAARLTAGGLFGHLGLLLGVASTPLCGSRHRACAWDACPSACSSRTSLTLTSESVESGGCMRNRCRMTLFPGHSSSETSLGWRGSTDNALATSRRTCCAKRVLASVWRRALNRGQCVVSGWVTRFWDGMVGLAGCWSCELSDAESSGQLLGHVHLNVTVT